MAGETPPFQGWRVEACRRRLYRGLSVYAGSPFSYAAQLQKCVVASASVRDERRADILRLYSLISLSERNRCLVDNYPVVGLKALALMLLT